MRRALLILSVAALGCLLACAPPEKKRRRRERPARAGQPSPEPSPEPSPVEPAPPPAPPERQVQFEVVDADLAREVLPLFKEQAGVWIQYEGPPRTVTLALRNPVPWREAISIICTFTDGSLVDLGGGVFTLRVKAPRVPGTGENELLVGIPDGPGVTTEGDSVSVGGSSRSERLAKLLEEERIGDYDVRSHVRWAKEEARRRLETEEVPEMPEREWRVTLGDTWVYKPDPGDRQLAWRCLQKEKGERVGYTSDPNFVMVANRTVYVWSLVVRRDDVWTEPSWLAINARLDAIQEEAVPLAKDRARRLDVISRTEKYHLIENLEQTLERYKKTTTGGRGDQQSIERRERELEDARREYREAKRRFPELDRRLTRLLDEADQYGAGKRFLFEGK